MRLGQVTHRAPQPLQVVIRVRLPGQALQAGAGQPDFSTTTNSHWHSALSFAAAPGSPPAAAFKAAHNKPQAPAMSGKNRWRIRGRRVRTCPQQDAAGKAKALALDVAGVQHGGAQQAQQAVEQAGQHAAVCMGSTAGGGGSRRHQLRRRRGAEAQKVFFSLLGRRPLLQASSQRSTT